MGIRVLHIGTDKQWRGGENQIRLLIIHSDPNEFEHHVAYPESSQALIEFEKIGSVCKLPSRSGGDPRSIIKVINYCREHHIDIIDAHSSAAMSLALAVKRFLRQVKVVVHRRVDFAISHGFFTRRKYMSSKVDQYIAISRCIEKRLLDYGIPKAKVRVVPSAIDASRYEKIDSVSERKILMQKAKLTPDTTMIGIAAAITGEKGHDVLIRACEKLKQNEVLFHCFIAGDGEKAEEMRALVKTLGLDKRITFLGHLNYVPGFLAGLDVLAVPSESEGLGTIVLEGISAGCAVVGTNVGGIPEMLIHQETGLLFERGDVNGLYQALLDLIEHPVKRQKLSQAARAHIDKNFSLQTMVSGNLEIYKNLMARGQS